MAEEQRKIGLPSVERRPVRNRGPLRSDEWNDFHEEVVTDITNLHNTVNTLYNMISKSHTVIANEAAYMKRQMRALVNQKEYLEKITKSNGLLSCRYIDFGDTQGISFPNGLNDDHSAMLHSLFGEVTLPAVSIENKFYVNSLTSGIVVTPPDLTLAVRGTFDKATGEGLINYERGGKVNTGDPKLAFNGNNQSYWVRRVEFPLDSKVDQVECELTVVVPEGVSTRANTIELIPFPNGSVDITELATASDLGDNFIRVEGFTPEDNTSVRRYHFPVKTVDQIRVRLRQRNWVEENGKKVFYYGLQELGLKLIDYDRSFSLGASFGTNNSFILEIPAPDGYAFNTIHRVDPNPNFLLEDQSKRHIHIRLNTRNEFSLGNIWDSDTMYPPQTLTSPISAGAAQTLYAFIQMNYVDNSGGTLGIFPVGTTPVIRGLGLTFNLVQL